MRRNYEKLETELEELVNTKLSINKVTSRLDGEIEGLQAILGKKFSYNPKFMTKDEIEETVAEIEADGIDNCNCDYEDGEYYQSLMKELEERRERGRDF